jgi:hypothetical protein
MRILAISLIGLGALNCSAIVFLLLDERKRGPNQRSFQENLVEIVASEQEPSDTVASVDHANEAQNPGEAPTKRPP